MSLNEIRLIELEKKEGFLINIIDKKTEELRDIYIQIGNCQIMIRDERMGLRIP